MVLAQEWGFKGMVVSFVRKGRRRCKRQNDVRRMDKRRDDDDNDDDEGKSQQSAGWGQNTSRTSRAGNKNVKTPKDGIAKRKRKTSDRKYGTQTSSHDDTLAAACAVVVVLAPLLCHLRAVWRLRSARDRIRRRFSRIVCEGRWGRWW